MTHPNLKDPRRPVSSSLARYVGPAFVAALALTVALTLSGPASHERYAQERNATSAGFAAEHPVATRIIRPPARFSGPAR